MLLLCLFTCFNQIFSIIKIFALTDNVGQWQCNTMSAWLATVGCFQAPHRALVVSQQVDTAQWPGDSHDHGRQHCPGTIWINKTQLLLTITWSLTLITNTFPLSQQNKYFSILLSRENYLRLSQLNTLDAWDWKRESILSNAPSN